MTNGLHEFKAELFRSMGNPVRIQILELLRAAGSLTVSEIQQRLGLESSNASQHLGVLRQRGLVSARREGTSVWYAIAEPEVDRLLDSGRKVFENQVADQVRLLKGDGDDAGAPIRTRRDS